MNTSDDIPHFFDSHQATGQKVRAAKAFFDSYQAAGQIEDLHRAIELCQEALNETSPGSPQRAYLLNALGSSLATLYGRMGNLADLDQAIEFFVQTLGEPSSLRAWGLVMSNLSNAFEKRYAHTGNILDLQQVIDAPRHVLKWLPPDSPERTHVLQSLVTGLRRLHALTGNPALLEESIQLSKQAIDELPPGSPDRFGLINELADALGRRYRRMGNSADLEEAIQLVEQQLEPRPTGSFDGPPYLLHSLANSLMERFKRTGNIVDLEQCIQLHRQVVKQKLDFFEQYISMNSLANALEQRYRRTKDMADLEQAIQLRRQVLDQVPRNASIRPSLLNNLGGALFMHYFETGITTDLDQAITLLEQAVEQELNITERFHWIYNLANALAERYHRMDDMTDLERAIQLYTQVVERTPLSSPDWPIALNGLANGLMELYKRSGNVADKTQAITYFEDACQKGMAVVPEAALKAAISWGGWALERKDWPEAVRAFTYGMSASEQLYKGQLLRTDKLSWLRDARGLHAYAAYALAQNGELRRAVETLEQGRARLLSQTLERDRTVLRQLQTLNPAVYAQFDAAATRLQRLEVQDLSGQVGLPPNQTLPDAIRQARTDLDAVVETIHRIPGYENFLKFFTFSQIQHAAGDTPLVYIIVTRIGGLALIVFPLKENGAEKREPETSLSIPTPVVLPLWLASLTEKAIREVMLADEVPNQIGYVRALFGSHFPNVITQDDWFKILDGATRWLWDVLMDPLLEALTSHKVERAVLIPQDVLGLLPLHAAWVPNASAPLGCRYALDTVAFSYVPNARALATARTIAARIAADTLLIVDQPSPVQAHRLTYAPLEVEKARGHFTTSTILRGEQASRSALLAAFSSGSPPAVWHFACHANADLLEPLSSGFLLAYDTRLTLRDLLQQQSSGVRLAVLSACETGIPGLELADEVISLPTGLIQAGVAGIIASLWAVDDFYTTMLLVRFYELWRDKGLPAVEALRQAQIWIRDTTNKEKADYFEGFLPIDVASQLYRKLMRLYPNRRNFAHPGCWSAFGFTGV